MIAIKLWGGLGNQLFQYAFGHFIADKRGEEIYYYLEQQNENKELLLITYFDPNISVLTNNQLLEYNYILLNSYIYRFKRKLIQLIPSFNPKICVEKGLFYKPLIFQNFKLYDGYWQSYKYIQPIESYLRDKLKFNLIDFKDIQYIDDILKNSSVSLHIRRGDYISKKNNRIFENCSFEYYKRAINEICKKVNNPHFYIFSNDLDWVKQNFILPLHAEYTFIDNSNMKNNTLADLYLMSRCKHHIIANSTFSWWGAWLNPSIDKIVIAPANWYVGKLNDSTVDLIPPAWIRI